MRTMIKRAGLLATLFFLVKGLVWLALLAGAAGLAGGSKAAGPENGCPRRGTVEAEQRSDNTWSQKVPMGLGRAAGRLKALTTFGVDGETQTTIGTAGLAVVALAGSLVAMRLNQLREARAGSIVSISRSTAGRTARAASLRPCV